MFKRKEKSNIYRLEKLTSLLEDKITLLTDIIKEKDIELSDLRRERIAEEVEVNRALNQINITIEETNNQNEELKSYIKALENLITMDIVELRKQPSNFPAPTFNVVSNEWETITAYCSLGGCEFRHFSNNSEKEALQQGIIATLKGQQVDIGTACRKCYSEYMQEYV